MSIENIIQNISNSSNIKIADNIANVGNLNLNIAAKENSKDSEPFSLIEYILMYVLIYTIGGLLFLFGMAIYSAKIMSGGSIINQNVLKYAIQVDHSLPMWDIAFVGFGLFVTLSVAVLHWFIKTTTCRDCTYLVLPRFKSKSALRN